MDPNLFCSKELYDLIASRCSALLSIIKQKEAELTKYPKDLPTGVIHALQKGKDHAREQFYLRSSTKDKSGKYLKKTAANKELAHILIQKEYDEKILAAATTEYNFLRRAEKFSSEDPLIGILQSMGDVKQKWVKPVLDTPESYAESWMAKSISSRPYKEDELIFTTKRKDFVRSKSEVLIANALYDHGIPYRYECPLTEGNRPWALPDFTILNVRQRKEYYWEHLGMMGDPEYSRKALRKIREYEKHGMFQGRKMIYTFESSDVPLDSENIENIIRAFLI